MNKKMFLCSITVFSALLFAGCQSSNSLAEYDGGEVKDSEVTEFLSEEKSEATLKVTLKKILGKKIKIDEKEINRLYKEQEKKVSDTVSKLTDQAKQTKNDIEFQLLLEKSTEKYLLSDEEALKVFYNGWQSPVKAYELAFTNQEEATAAAQELSTEGADIAKIADKYHCTTDTGIKEISLNTTNKEIENAVYALKNKGEVTPVVTTPFGYYVMVLEQASEKKSFEESKEQLQQAYLKVKLNASSTKDMITDTLKKNHVKFNDTNVTKMVKEMFV